jgi:hypothetical protein
VQPGATSTSQPLRLLTDCWLRIPATALSPPARDAEGLICMEFSATVVVVVLAHFNWTPLCDAGQVLIPSVIPRVRLRETNGIERIKQPPDPYEARVL